MPGISGTNSAYFLPVSFKIRSSIKIPNENSVRDSNGNPLKKIEINSPGRRQRPEFLNVYQSEILTRFIV
jgi:hypothetical protein